MTQKNPNGQPLAFGAALLKAASMLNVHPAFMQGAIEDSTEGLVNALRTGLASGAVRPKWKTLYRALIGGGTKEHLIEAAGITGGRTKHVLRKPELEVSSIRQTVNIAVASPRDLGFTGHRVNTLKFFERAHEFGLKLCPRELALRLLTDSKQLNLNPETRAIKEIDWWSMTGDSYISVAMDPLNENGVAMDLVNEDGDGTLIIFGFMVQGGEFEFCLLEADETTVDRGFIFVLP